MVIWEYNVFCRPTTDRKYGETNDRLNGEGLSGWELVSVVASEGYSTYFMKRIKNPE